MLPVKVAVSAAIGLSLLGVNAVAVSFGLASTPLFLSSLVMVAAEGLKVAFAVRRFHSAIDGNVMTPLMVAEGLSLLIDVLAVVLAVHAEAIHVRAGAFILCADFLILRIVGWNAISHFFWK